MLELVRVEEGRREETIFEEFRKVENPKYVSTEGNVIVHVYDKTRASSLFTKNLIITTFSEKSTMVQTRNVTTDRMRTRRAKRDWESGGSLRRRSRRRRGDRTIQRRQTKNEICEICEERRKVKKIK